MLASSPQSPSPQAESNPSMYSGRASPPVSPLNLENIERYTTSSEEETESEHRWDKTMDHDTTVSEVLRPSTFQEQLTASMKGGYGRNMNMNYPNEVPRDYASGYVGDEMLEHAQMHAEHAQHHTQQRHRDSFHSIGSETQGSATDSAPTVVERSGSSLPVPDHWPNATGQQRVPAAPKRGGFYGYQPSWNVGQSLHWAMGMPPNIPPNMNEQLPRKDMQNNTGAFNHPAMSGVHPPGPLVPGGSIATSGTTGSALFDRQPTPANTSPSAAVMEFQGSSSSSYRESSLSNSSALPSDMHGTRHSMHATHGTKGGKSALTQSQAPIDMHDQHAQNVAQLMNVPPSEAYMHVATGQKQPQPGLPPLQFMQQQAGGLEMQTTSVDAAADKFKASGGLYVNAGSGAMSGGDIRAVASSSMEPHITATSPVESSAPLTMGCAGDCHGGFAVGPSQGGFVGMESTDDRIGAPQVYGVPTPDGSAAIDRKKSVTAFVAAVCSGVCLCVGSSCSCG